MSPHFGLIDENTMSIEAVLLMRAKLHWRCGMRRMREEKTHAGLVTLYDAVLSAMRWYILTRLQNISGEEIEEQIENERFVFFLMHRAGILDNTIDLQLIEENIDKALMEEDVSSQQDAVLQQFHELMTRTGVLPFDLSELPPEDPATF